MHIQIHRKEVGCRRWKMCNAMTYAHNANTFELFHDSLLWSSSSPTWVVCAPLPVAASDEDERICFFELINLGCCAVLVPYRDCMLGCHCIKMTVFRCAVHNVQYVRYAWATSDSIQNYIHLLKEVITISMKIMKVFHKISDDTFCSRHNRASSFCLRPMQCVPAVIIFSIVLRVFASVCFIVWSGRLSHS